MFFVIAVLIVGIWVVIEAKRLNHKILAIVLISLVLIFYFTFTISLRNQNVDLKTIPGIISAGKIYGSWIAGAFSNVKSITAYASKQNWTNTSEISKSNTSGFKDEINSGQNLFNREINTDEIWEKLKLN